MAENLLSDSDVWGAPAQPAPSGLLSDDDLWGTPKPKEQRGAVAEIGRQIVGGLVTRAPGMIGSALEWWAPQGSDLEDAGRVAKEYWAEKEKAWTPDLEGRGFVSSTLIKGATQLAPSMLGMGAAMINPALGAAAVTTLFGGQQAQSTYDKAIEAGLKEPEASMAAYKTGLIEAFGETVADVTGAKFLMGAGKLASGLLGKGTGEAIRAAINPAVAAKFARDWAANAVIQSGTEFGQGYGEAAVEKDAGISTEDPFSQGTEGAQSALGMSVLLGPLAAAGHVSAGRKRAMVGQALNDPSAPLPIRMAAGEYVAKDIEPSVGKEAAQSWLQSFHEAAVQDRDAQQQRAPAEFKDDQEATAPTGLLGYQAGPPLVVFPDGSTMTGAEAEQRRLDAMVQRAQPADILTAPDVDTAIAAAVDSVAAVTDAADEFADLQKQEESDLAYRRREVAENAAKAADFARAKQQQADITVDQANALTRVSGFDDQTPTAMQLALQRAQQQKTAAPAQTPASATPIKAQPEPVAAAPNVAAQPAPPVSVQRLDETAVAAAPNVDSYLKQNAAGKWQLSRPVELAVKDAVIAEMDRRNQEGSTNAAQAAESPLPAVPQEARQGAPLPAEVANGSTNEPAPAPVPGQRGAILDDARQAVPQGASAAQAVPDAAAQDQGSDRGAVEPTNSLQRTASWVIKNKKTGEVVMETFDRKKVDALNTQKYVAVPIVEHLASIGRERISVPDLISESTNIGVNRDGKQIYENKRGRFVVRHDNKKYEPDGWTDFGGDLAPVEQTPPTPNESPAAQLGGTTPKVGAGETAMIGDFGSRIEGARKDYASKLKEAESADIASVPLSQSWPEPDYQKMLDAGSEPWAVAFMRASRDEVPTKPQSPWKLSRWVKQVAQLRDFAMRVVDGSMGADRVKEAMGADSAMKVIMDRIDLYTEVGHDKSLKGIRVSAGDYSVYEGVEYKPAKRIWSVEQKAAKTAFSNWPKMIATGDTREEAIANFKSKWLETSPDQDAKKAIDFSIYRKLAVNEFFVGKKIGKDVVPFKEGFKTALEARAWKDANQTELVKMLERFKDIPSERRESNSPRVGIDHRNGADVTMQQFAETFGFRGGQFGASMPQDERQSNLNETYDALMDMAGILGVPPKALSLNGELGLAFGARGKGGKGAFAAHYEADTTGKVTADRVVINLTRARGAGSLAHEWFHAVDNYFGRKGGRAGAFQTEAQRGEGVRPEMLDAFKRIMQAINSTSLKMRGQKLDQTRSKAYWSTGLEMAARSFESYIVTKLQDQNAANDYLANIVSEDYWNAAAALGIEKEGTYPYPTAAEVPAIRAAFDHFFQTVETKETDTGIAFNSLEDDHQSAVTRAIDRALAQESEQPTETQRGVGWLKIKLRQAQHKGDLSAEAVEMVEWLVKQNPALVKYLAVAIENPKVMEEGFNAVSSAPTFKAVIPRPQIPAKLSQREFSSILQDIDGYGPIAEDDPYRISELGAIVKKLKAAGVNHIDMYHVTDANLEDFKGDGVRGSEVDYIGRSGQNARASSVYGFLDPDDIKVGYPGVLGASSETPNVIHIRVPVDLIGGFRWDGNFNITYGAYSGVRYVGNIPSAWIEGAYRYDIAKNSVIATEFPQANPDISQSIDRPTGAAGNYNPFTQVMTLFRGNASDTTAIHEILHHLERMMPAEMQAEIRKEWLRAVTGELQKATKAKDQPRIDYFKTVLAGDQKKATELLTGKGMEGFNAPPREESASKSVKRDMLKYPNMSFPLSMPQEMRDEILKWNAVSQSPYSESFYDITNKGWDNDPDSFLRVADHWAFESGGRIHAQTDIDVEPGNWTLAEHGPDGVYRVIKSVPRLPTDSAQYRENVARRSAEFEQKKRDAADLKDRIRKAIAKAIGTEIADDPASPLKGAGYQRRELGKTKEDKRQSALIGNLFPNHIEEIWATRSTKRDAVSPETYAIPLEKSEAAFAAKSAEARSGQEFNSIGFNAVEPAPTFKAVDTESAEFKRWFEGSAVTDSDGKPLRVYHWSMNGDITEFRTEATDQDIGAHFGSVVAANGRADNLQKTSGNIYAVFLSIKNPLRITDEQAGLGGGGWSGFDLLDRLIARKIFTQKEYSRAAGEYNKNETPGSRAWPFSKEARDFIRKKLEQNGYDGIVYSNQHEGNNGVGDGSDSYIAFRPEQIKSAISNTGAFDPSNPDILQDLAIGQDYQYLNPSEFWAVRMTSTMAARFEAKSIWARSLQWLKEALEHIKGALGLKSDHPLLKALDDLIKNGNGEFVSKEMLGSSEVYAAPRIIGDSGRQYTPDQEAMFKQTGREVDQGTVLGKLKEWAAANWRQGLFDQFQPARAISAHGYTLLRLSKGATGAFEALMGHGKLSIRDGAYDADTSGGVMQEVFFQLGKESTDFLYWIAGNRAERLAMEGKERLFSVHDIAAAKSLAVGTTDFDYALANGQTTRDRTLIYRDSLTKFNAFNKNVMDMAEQSGLIDAASRHLWEHEFYVPFYRVMDEKDGGVRGMNIKQGVVRQQAFKKLNGGKEGLNDLLANTLMNWAHLIDAAAKNRGAKETLEAAVRMGAAHPAVAGEKNTVWYMDGGKKVELTVDDPELMVAISALDYSGLRGIAMDALSNPKHWLTIGVTASPFFKIRNLIRDSVQAVATSGLSFNIAGNVAEGIKLTNRDRQEYVSALAGGGLIRFGTMLEGNEAARTRQLIKKGATDEHILDSESKVRRFYDKFLEPAVAAYNELGNRGEEINRMSLYDQLTKQGVDHATASLMARDLMDFSMQGSWTAIRFLAQIVPFFNARMQGMYKLGRAAKSDPAKFATVLGAVTMFSLALLAAYHDDDDWKKREEWDRDNYWWFKVGGVAFRIPKPFEIGAIATLAERSAELMFDDEMTGKRFRKVTTKLLADQLSMNPTPQLIKPIIDLYANKDSFSGRAIETMGMERVDSERRFNSGTSMPARGLSTAIGGALSPVQIDHLVRGYFAWLGAFTVGAADMAVRAASNEPTKPASDYWKVATGGMVAGLDGAGSRYVSQMYDQAKEIEMAYNTYRDMLKTAAQKQGAAKTETLDEAKEYRESNADKLNRYRGIEGAKRRLSTINQRIKSIERGDMTADEKRQAIIGLNKQKDMVARQIAR